MMTAKRVVGFALSSVGACAVLACMLAAALSTRAPADTGAAQGKSARWENGLPASPDFFPIAVWVQQPRNAAAYKALGVNVYVGLWQGPTEAQLDELEKAGVYVICGQNEVGLRNKHRKVIAGWMHGDEPDNAQSLGPGKGYGPPVKPEAVVADYERMRAADPTRPVLLNLGQGVAWDGWYGRGVRTNHPEDYPQYVKGCDIASFDIYPASHDKPEVAGQLWRVGHGVRRLREWSGGGKPVWACIETTRVNNADAVVTPAQVTAEVWIAVVHGATGIIYFCHEFAPRFVEAGLLARRDVADAVKATNARLQELAPVLNSPTLADAATVTPADPDAPIELLCKRHGGHTYLFAVATRGLPSKGAFAVKGLSGTASVEVIGEGRTLTARAGAFSDAFDGYGVHLYRVATPRR